MRKVAIIFGVFVALIIAAVVIVPTLVSKDDILQQVTGKVEQTTGREFRIEGEQTLSVFPSLVLELNDVQFANFEQGTEANMATMKKLSLHVPWTSVFSGKVIIEQFVIDEIHLLLEKQADGTANWQFTELAAQSAAPLQNQEQSSTGTTSLPGSFDLSLGQVQINGGSLTFIDHQNQTTERVDQLALEVILPSLRKPLKVNGQVRYKLQTFTLDMMLDTPIKAIEGAEFSTDLSLNSDLVNLSYAGSVIQQPFAVTGKLSIEGDSVKQIAAWQEQPMAVKDDAFNQFSVAAALEFTGNRFDMTELSARLDALEIKGNTSILLNDMPAITAVVNLGDLNLNPYIPDTSETAPPPESQAKTPIVWDDTPIDLSGLSAVNLDLTVTSDSLQAKEIKLGANKFTLKIQNSVMNLAMEDFNAYKGKGTSTIFVNASKKPYEIATDFSLSGIDFEPLLTDAAGFDKLMGNGQFEWRLATSGVSQKDFVSALDGTVGFDIKNGAVRGANIAAIAESAAAIFSGDLESVNLDQDFNNAEQTDFASLAGTLNFAKGVGTTNDVALLNPLVRVTAEGTIDLPATMLDMRSSSKLVSSLEGQGGQVDESGITIPIKLVGPFHDVKVKPDLSSGIKDKIESTIKNKLKGLFGG